jgi:hypothetical protein
MIQMNSLKNKLHPIHQAAFVAKLVAMQPGSNAKRAISRVFFSTNPLKFDVELREKGSERAIFQQPNSSRRH